MTPKTILSFEDALRAVADGKRLLVRRPLTECAAWSDWSPHRSNPNSVLLCRAHQYALAPDVIRCRRWLARYTDGTTRVWCHNEGTAHYPESVYPFARWIDTDWQEVEV